MYVYNTSSKQTEKQHTLCIADYNTIALFTATCQLFDCIHSNNDIFNLTFKMLSDDEKPMATRASDSFKLHIVKSKKSCKIFFFILLSKLWNILPNNVTCITNFNAFCTSIVKRLFR